MKSFFLACVMILFATAVSAQSMSNLPSIPGMNGSSATKSDSSSSSSSITKALGGSKSSNPVENAMTEAKCKLPANATKAECIKLMLQK